MKKIILLVVTLFIGLFSFGQEDKNISMGNNVSKEAFSKIQAGIADSFKSKISMDIDTKIYTTNYVDTYFTSDKKSSIIGMLVASSYEKLKIDLMAQQSNKDNIILERGELAENGEKVLFTKAILNSETVIRKEGEFTEDVEKVLFTKTKSIKGAETYIMYVYSKENDEDSSIMITAYFEESKESEYIDMVQKVVFSAKVKIKK